MCSSHNLSPNTGKTIEMARERCRRNGVSTTGSLHGVSSNGWDWQVSTLFSLFGLGRLIKTGLLYWSCHDKMYAGSHFNVFAFDNRQYTVIISRPPKTRSHFCRWVNCVFCRQWWSLPVSDVCTSSHGCSPCCCHWFRVVRWRRRGAHPSKNQSSVSWKWC